MRPEAVAILSSIGWPVDSVLVRLGARTSNVVAAAFLSYFIAAAFFWIYVALFLPKDIFSSPAIIYFVLSGCFQPLLARICYYMGLMRLGVSRAAPLRGVEPLFALAMALAFLREQPNSQVYLGTSLIVASVWLITSRGKGEGEWKLWHLVFPLGAALFGAVSQNLRRGGLLILSDPVFGAAVSSSTSFILFSLFLAASGRIRLITTNKRSFPFFGSAALVSLVAQLLNFTALNLSEVSIIVPLVNTTPLFSVLFSSFFLKDLVKVTSKLVGGATLMVAGAAIIASR
ncbi:MAG TPA: DMT family transporter [Candidatus Binatia bacterium]|nr:DMT family transporter [Candidatus Binatia bacterium]